jgi:hypothetical protein
MATTTKVGSRRANCPMHRQSARQQRAATVPSVLAISGTCDGCNPNTVMRTDWRASLVPAAAVIPAPRACTNIAAVKTLVVCPWVQVCWVAGQVPFGLRHAAFLGD